MSAVVTPRSADVARPKKQRNFRLSDECNAMLVELAASFAFTETAVIELAIRHLYRRETGRKKPEKPGENDPK